MRASTRMTVQAAIAAILLAIPTFMEYGFSQPPAFDNEPASPGQGVPGHSPAFEVVSIRPSGKETGFSFMRNPNGFSATHQTVTGLVLLAYLPMPLWSADRIRHAPQWANQQEFDILAKVAPEDIPAWQGPDGSKLQMAMLRSMLTDRFKLVVHAEPAETPGFALVAAKPRPGLKASAPGEALPKPAMKLSAGGVAVGQKTTTGYKWTFYAAPMASLLSFLSMGAHTIIEDRTGLRGSYDFDLVRRDDADPYDHGNITDPGDIRIWTRWD